MPLYEYQCEACDHRFERIQKFSDPLVDICPKCGKGPVRKLISSPAIQFKGSGWYITDYAKKSSDSGSSGADKKDKKDKQAETSDKSDSATKTDSGTSSSSTNTTKSDS